MKLDPSKTGPTPHRFPIVGNSPAMRHAMGLAAVFARSDDPVLILGERGTGKSSLALLIHRLSGRLGDFVICQFAAGPEGLQESELFGHLKGAFTGADRHRRGRVESAADGTLFLDELGVAKPPTQPLLLSLFNEGAAYRVGEDRPLPITARIVGASNVDLGALVARERFRADLLDRFGHLRIFFPPLRDRRDEIIPIFNHVWSTRRPTEPPPSLDARVTDALLGDSWPGNVRELESVARYVAMLADPAEPITLDHLPPEFLSRSAGPTPHQHRRSAEDIHEAMDEAHGNKAEAARRLGLSRRTIQRRTNGRRV